MPPFHLAMVKIERELLRFRGKRQKGTLFFFAILPKFSRRFNFLLATISASDFKGWGSVQEIVLDKELERM